ncbi:putative transposase for the insertion element IS2606 [Mycobacterium ulcerans str. Harvey]|uniref:Transposase for the insertion element IS2606 n=1 Tax=Mycobacterium ulcerans str. Harvey TaxID=1299332 RepID=A0ABN0QZB3_MYCUL|nr:putative transposase for the insertion element IS2606 [Mycobacterium ulcerans str. Harvey]
MSGPERSHDDQDCRGCAAITNHEDEAGAVAAIDVPSSRDVDELEVARELVPSPRAGVG